MSGADRTERSGEDGIWQYKARWRSPLGYLTILLVLLAAVMLMPLADVQYKFAWGALLFGGLAWLIGKPILTGGWIVRIGPRGISSHALNGRTVPWRDVRDLGIETVQGNTFIVLTLAPDATESLEKTKRWLSGKKPQRRIPLAGLKPAQVKEVVAAAQDTFAARAGQHAAAAVQARQEEARYEAEFEQDLARTTPTTWALYLVMGLNVAVWLANVFTGMSPMRPASPELFRWGANSAWAVTREHEYWRLLTATFLHGGVIHLGMNMLGLWGAGKLLNRLYGNVQFLLVYFASALAGSAASLHFGAQASVSVGASGAVFGVLGAVIFAARKHRERLPKALTRQVLTSEGLFLAYALLNGFTRQGIDNAAHVGGLMAGAGMAWVLAGTFDPGWARRGKRAALAAVATLVAVAAVVAATPSPRVDHRSLFAADAQFRRVGPRVQQVFNALQADSKALKGSPLADALERKHLPALRSAQAELARLPRVAGDLRSELGADMQQLVAKAIELAETEVRLLRGQAGPDANAQVQRLHAEAQAITQRMQERTAAAKGKKP